MTYISNKFREKVVALLVSVAAIEDMKLDEEKYKSLFGKGFPWLKQAATLVNKAMKDGLNPIIGPDEAAKIHHYVQKYRIVLMRPSEPIPVDYSSLPTGDLHMLSEMAIGNKCTGCTIEKHKECPLYQILHKAEIPAACYEKGKCPYVQ